MDTEIKAGAKVYYTSMIGSKENGIVKSVTEYGTHAFVVYRCADDWDNYKNYTGENTRMVDLSYGWVDENGNLLKEFCDHHYIHTNYKWQPINQMKCDFCGDVIN